MIVGEMGNELRETKVKEIRGNEKNVFTWVQV